MTETLFLKETKFVEVYFKLLLIFKFHNNLKSFSKAASDIFTYRLKSVINHGYEMRCLTTFYRHGNQKELKNREEKESLGAPSCDSPIARKSSSKLAMKS